MHLALELRDDVERYNVTILQSCRSDGQGLPYQLTAHHVQQVLIKLGDKEVDWNPDFKVWVPVWAMEFFVCVRLGMRLQRSHLSAKEQRVCIAHLAASTACSSSSRKVSGLTPTCAAGKLMSAHHQGRSHSTVHSSSQNQEHCTLNPPLPTNAVVHYDQAGQPALHTRDKHQGTPVR
jgi:hypothetical protein